MDEVFRNLIQTLTSEVGDSIQKHPDGAGGGALGEWQSSRNVKKMSELVKS